MLERLRVACVPTGPLSGVRAVPLLQREPLQPPAATAVGGIISVAKKDKNIITTMKRFILSFIKLSTVNVKLS